MLSAFLFAFMGTGLGAIVLLYSIGYMGRDRAITRFYATMLIFIGGFVALVYCANLFLLYICWEVIGLCSFSLVGFWYQQREAVLGARKVLLMTHLAGYGLLSAILVLYHRTGTAIWTDPSIGRNFSTGVFLLMLIALVAKSVQVPLHTWIPDAMAAPTPVSSLLHAACYVTAGVYLAARMHSFAAWQPSWNFMLVSIASVTMMVGVMYALVQSDLKRMLAFSTVSQIGYMLLGIGIGTPLGIMAGLLHCLNHGFFKGGLFLNAGAVQHAAGTRDMNLPGRTCFAHAAHNALLAGGRWEHGRHPADERLRQQVDALRCCNPGRMGNSRGNCMDRKPRNCVHVRESDQRGIPGTAVGSGARRARSFARHAVGDGVDGLRQHRAGRGAAACLCVVLPADVQRHRT